MYVDEETLIKNEFSNNRDGAMNRRVIPHLSPGASQSSLGTPGTLGDRAVNETNK